MSTASGLLLYSLILFTSLLIDTFVVLTYISEEIFPWMTAIFHAMSIETFMATLGTISDDFFEFKGIEMDDAREYMRELCRIQEDIHKAFPFNTDNRKDGE